MSIDDESRGQIRRYVQAKHIKVRDDISIEDVEQLPIPEKLRSQNSFLEYVGKVKRWSVYIIKKGFSIISIICTLLAIPKIPEQVQIYFPNAYQVAQELYQSVTQREEPSFGTQATPMDGYVMLQPAWRDNPNLFENNLNDFRRGSFENAFSNDVALFPASGSMPPISDGTTSSFKYYVKINSTA